MAQLSDSFNRPNTTNGLGSIPGGPAWEVVQGTWRIADGKPQTSTPRTEGPFVVVPAGPGSDFDITMDAGPGDAIYARVVDRNNWFRARVWRYEVLVQKNVEQTLYRAFYSHGGVDNLQHWDTEGISDTPNVVREVWATSLSDARSQFPSRIFVTHNHDKEHGHWYDRGNVFATTQTRVTTTSVTEARFEVRIENMLGGTLWTIARSSAYTSWPGRIRFRGKGSALAAYVGTTTRAAEQNNISHRDATRHGFGVTTTSGTGATDPTRTIDNWSFDSLNDPPYPPDSLSPDGTTVDVDRDTNLSFRFRDPNTGDSQSAAEVQWREVGATTWETTGKVWTTSPRLTIGAGTFSVGVEYEWRVHVWDSGGRVSLWSSPARLTGATAPDAPTILAPGPEATIPEDHHVMQWSTPEQDAYRIFAWAPADATTPDQDTVYYDSGVVEEPSGRDHVVPAPVVGRREFWAVQVRYDGIWGPAAYVPVNVQWTPPRTPYLRLEAGESDVAVTPTHLAPQGTQPAVREWRLWARKRDTGGDGEVVPYAYRPRRLSAPPAATVVHYLPVSFEDYEYRAETIGDNGTRSWSDWQIATVEPPDYDPGDFQSDIYFDVYHDTY